MAGCAQEYLEPLANLQENMQIRTKVAGENFAVMITYLLLQPTFFFACFCSCSCLSSFTDHSMVRYLPRVYCGFPYVDLPSMLASGIYRELCLESVKNKYECEIQAACQHWEVRGLHMSQELSDD